MIASRKNYSKPAKLTPYARRATKAMIKAQKFAAQENARYGLPLIVLNSGNGKKSGKKK